MALPKHTTLALCFAALRYWESLWRFGEARCTLHFEPPCDSNAQGDIGSWVIDIGPQVVQKNGDVWDVCQDPFRNKRRVVEAFLPAAGARSSLPLGCREFNTNKFDAEGGNCGQENRIGWPISVCIQGELCEPPQAPPTPPMPPVLPPAWPPAPPTSPPEPLFTCFMGKVCHLRHQGPGHPDVFVNYARCSS